MYKAIFFDIDDTLLDFNAASQSAFYQSFQMLNIDVEDPYYHIFQNIDHALWQTQKLGKITVDDVINLRFQQLFITLGIDADDMAMRDTFQYHLSLEATIEKGACEVLDYLHPKYTLYTASNGILAMQESRLRRANLLEYFSGLFVSDDIGYEKPHPQFFETCITRSQLSANEILFVGDSWAADIVGAANYGIDTCWYNPMSLESPNDYQSEYIIQNLSELISIL